MLNVSTLFVSLSLSLTIIEYLIISGVIAYPNNTADELYDFSYTNFSCPNVSSCNGTQVSNCTGNGGLLGIRCNYGKVHVASGYMHVYACNMIMTILRLMLCGVSETVYVLHLCIAKLCS